MVKRASLRKAALEWKISMSNDVSCIINPKAAQQKWFKNKRLRDYLKEQFPGRIYDERDSKEKTIQLAREVSQKQKVVIAVGGDGTMADVLQGIVEARREKDVLFGIIPFGSGNAFRRSLSIPLNVRRAVRILYEGNTKEIDLIEIEGKVAGIASVGAIAELTHEALKENTTSLYGHLKQSRKVFSISKSEQDIELFDGIDDEGNHFEKKDLRLQLLDCVIAKTNYFGYGWRIAPKAKLDDGYLDITFFEISAFKYLLCLPLIFFGLYQKTQRHFKAKKMIIKGKGLHIQYNGEYLGTRDRIEMKVIPRAVKVICPLNK